MPRAPTPDKSCVAGEAGDQPERKASSARTHDDVRRSTGQAPDSPDTRTRAPAQPAETPSAPRQGKEGAAVELTPNVLAVKHWDRLRGGLLYAATPRVDWATLLRRSFEIDVLRCAACGGRMRVLGEVTRADVIVLVLESLGLPTHAPRAARARDPTELLGEQDVE